MMTWTMMTASLLAVMPASGPDLAPLVPKPRVILNLKTPEGAQAMSAEWRTADVHVLAAQGRSPDDDGRVTGMPWSALDLHPRIGSPDFDTVPWASVSPGELEHRRGSGKVSFQWYRLNLRIPDRVGELDPTGSTIILDLRIDDYAEVWVNGALPYRFAQTGGAVIAGWNASNRILLSSDARPGETFDVAIFAVNGPISEVPENFIWVRSAAVEVYANPRAVTPEAVSGSLVRYDPRLDSIIAPGTPVERIATGFVFTEGPVWDRQTGSLLFSDPNANTIYRWCSHGSVEVVRFPSGYAGADVAEYRQPGSNGLTFDNEGRLTINQHGNRRVIRLEHDGSETVLADRHHGRRLNSPNDLVYRSDGALYFTDPPFGLPRGYDDPARETPHFGVYRLDHAGLSLLTTSHRGPNGIAFNHKETVLYVGDWDERHKVVTAYPVLADGSLGEGTVFCDLTAEPGDEAIDGVKCDSRGNVYVCGPGGLWIFAADGTRLGLLRNTETPHNIAFGDPDGRTLYMTCHTGVYRVRLGVSGPMP
ncbi:MAG: SMP-30/gluconolactonase/LRE family protein [Leptolyngbya sp. PLA2]|nr:SMP-30/gluconolactonase/LRE family protein [Leptolyngbya sp.]MCE7970896.1 SMP-30/gluconolactonase/LRE family protein [Leptolyngbya sp. PL-A2]MCQ3940289.1 SMP-30/gluconolactonase/LRE family protein [cyanobacterium CYA1]MCZ7633737.1 SMP-30/gluconolactonase/LRE family protein [Phycisphaerales bacterium]MDL1904641.1 SMP-30/gluconolactonase/LRE family protein [Synechococcales cyanobacterium CNB]GIK20394.1 MAG: hypothetical protein BroJett004_25580 [Planctomycetota bacterium]